MGKIERMSIGDSNLYKDNVISGNYNQYIYLTRAEGNQGKNPMYYLWIYGKENGTLVKQGYIYFELDFDNKKSSFIGIKVEERFRSLNISSLLLASWIELCLNNGYDYLGVNQKQRKPFLLFLLKKYGFDVENLSLYDTRPDVISICRDLSKPKDKILLFKDARHENVFKNMKICQEDKYRIIHSMNGMRFLDKVILPLQGAKKANIEYLLLNELLAEEKVESTLKRHRR